MNVLVGKNLESGQIQPIKIPDARVTAIIQCYNSAATMKDTLESLQGNVDRIICLDGYFRMENTPHAHPAKNKTGTSDDGSKELAKKYGAEWISGDREYDTQIDKLNRIPELVPEGEWCLIIDTDEILVSYIKDGLRSMAGYLGKWCDMIPLKISEPFYEHPFTGQAGRHRFMARLLRIIKGMSWPLEGVVVYPGRITTYFGTFPNVVYLQHNRREH